MSILLHKWIQRSGHSDSYSYVLNPLRARSSRQADPSRRISQPPEELPVDRVHVLQVLPATNQCQGAFHCSATCKRQVRLLVSRYL